MTPDEKRIVGWLQERECEYRPFGLVQGDTPSAVISEIIEAIESGQHRKDKL